MSAIFEQSSGCPADRLPLLEMPCDSRAIAFRDGRALRRDDFLRDVETVARTLPAARYALPLCEDRYAFLVAFCAVALCGQTNLLPPSRAPQVIDELLLRHADCHVLADHDPVPPPRRWLRLPELPAPCAPVDTATPELAGGAVVALGHTSGSTGQPKPFPKSWSSFRASTARTVEVLTQALALAPAQSAHVVATVPPQHMYGIELSVLLPLLGPFAIHAGKPFLPADIAAALATVPAPRLLVTTPVHLRALLREQATLPPIGAIVSATAPLPADLAAEAEVRYGARVVEVFGSTETCVIAHRRAARDEPWNLYPGVELRPQPDGTAVHAPWFAAPVVLQDVVEVLPEHRFILRGRNADLLEIAGKRASLGDLTHRLLALPGVIDAVVFQHEAADAAGVQRVAALVVAPGRGEAELLAELRRSIDPAFLPRPLRRVERLPRNETGKLPHLALLGMLGK